MHLINPVILCGGSGTRLWPLSTPERPKQFLNLTSEKSMIEETALRFATSRVATLSFSDPLVVGSKRHASLLEKTFPGGRKILEPFGRNSAPAVAAACLSYDPQDLILILPADHDILDVEAFHQAIECAAIAAEDGAIVTFGIEPTHPATGYGYIKATADAVFEAVQVDAFVEKPDFETAQSYVTAGKYYWNAGIFLFRVDTMIAALESFAPEVLLGVRQAMTGHAGKKIAHLNAEAFVKTPSISIDFAVMEKAKNIQTVPLSMGWSDVGGYRALHGLLTNNPTDNYTSGRIIVNNADGLYVRSEGPVIAVTDVSNLAIVATENEVLITPIDDDSKVKALVAAVKSDGAMLGLSATLKQRAKNWLIETLKTWENVAWDRERGGFVEQLHLDGSPDPEAVRRVRVQARQVFTFAKAIELNWYDTEKAEVLVNRGIEYIDAHLRHPDQGFVHLINCDGSVVDERRDFYDHAFIVLASSAAYKATGNETALNIAQDALHFLNADLKDDVHGGWFESTRFELPRRANPHMHMLEALLEYYSATGSSEAISHAAEIVRLFETKFFNPGNNVMAEYFEKDWSVPQPENQVTWEPGHHYEWSTLLSKYQQVSDHDSLSWRRRLITHADLYGICERTGASHNSLRADGIILNKASRLWHQLERFKAYLYHPSVTSAGAAERILDSIMQNFLVPGPDGVWIDEIDHNGSQVSTNVPASMLYHIITALGPV